MMKKRSWICWILVFTMILTSSLPIIAAELNITPNATGETKKSGSEITTEVTETTEVTATPETTSTPEVTVSPTVTATPAITEAVKEETPSEEPANDETDLENDATDYTNDTTGNTNDTVEANGILGAPIDGDNSIEETITPVEEEGPAIVVPEENVPDDMPEEEIPYETENSISMMAFSNTVNSDAMDAYMLTQTGTPHSGTYSTLEATNLPGSWWEYINSIWEYKAMGIDNDSSSRPGFSWTDPTNIDSDIPEWDGTYFDGLLLPLRDDTGTTVYMPAYNQENATADEETDTTSNWYQTNIRAQLPENANRRVYPLNTWTSTTTVETKFYVYSATQLRQALEYNGRTQASGGGAGKTCDKLTIVIGKDLNMAGYAHNWDTLSLYPAGHPRLVIEGNGHTIYNLGIYHTKIQNNRYPGGSAVINDSNHAAGLVIGYGGLDVRDITFETAKIVVAKDTNAPATGIFGRAEIQAANWQPSAWVTSGNKWELKQAQIRNVKINESMFFSEGGDSTVGTTDYQYRSNISALGEFSHNTDPNSADGTENDGTRGGYGAVINKCQVTGCYIYGADHAAGLTTGNFAGNTANTYVTDTLIATYGGHSGGFVSCNVGSSTVDKNRVATINHCFSDVEMYAATDSAGFIGLFSGQVNNCFSIGKLEAYRNCGGFGVEVANTGVYGTTIISNCYSAALVGMRSESENLGGFYAAGAATTDKIASYQMTNCYAVGEVGDVDVNSAYTANINGTKGNGGFVSAMGSTKGIGDTVTNCYYDKQTTAMKEWSSGDYNSLLAELDSGKEQGTTNSVATGVVGVETRNWEYTDESNTYYVGGLVGANPSATSTKGFKGFSSNVWIYTDTNYPQINAFSNAAESDGWDASQLELVQRYSNVSTSTIFLDQWKDAYTWDEYGDRSITESPSLEHATKKYVVDAYSYDTVRSMTTDAQYSSTNIIVNDMLHKQPVTAVKDNPGAPTGEGVDTDTSLTTFNIVSENYLIQKQSAGVGWLGLFYGEGSNRSNILRPFRLCAIMNVQAGQSQGIKAGVNYDHRDDVQLYAGEKLMQNMVLGRDDMQTWAEVIRGGFATANEEASEGDCSSLYYNARTYNMDQDEEIEEGSTNDRHATDQAILNTEIWRVKQLYPADTTLGRANENDTTWVYTGDDGADAIDQAFPSDADCHKRYYWCAEVDEDENIGVYLRIKVGNIDANPVFSLDRYVDDYSVNITGEGVIDTDNLDRQKWRGELALYPDTSSPKKYTVTYYWILTDGRYVSDFKTISIMPGYYNLYMSTHNYDTGSFTDPLNRYAISMQATKDVRTETGTDESTGEKTYGFDTTYDFTGATTNASSLQGPEGAIYDFEELATKNPDGEISTGEADTTLDSGQFTTNITDSVIYTNDGTAAFQVANEEIDIEKIQITMYARNGNTMGSGYVVNGSGLTQAANGRWTGGITLPVKYYGITAQTNASGITKEHTTETTANVTYDLIYDETQRAYYLRLNKQKNRPDDAASTSPNEIATSPGYDTGIEPSDTTAYINDMQYHVRVDFWVATYDLTLEKQIVGDYADIDAKFGFDVELDGLKMNADDTLLYYLGTNSNIGDQPEATGFNITPLLDPTTNDIITAKATLTGLTLGQHDTMTVKDLPVGIRYDMKETGIKNLDGNIEASTEFSQYYTSVKSREVNSTTYHVETPVDETVDASPLNPVVYWKAKRETRGIITKENTIDRILYVNSKGYIVPTNATTTNIWSYIIACAISLVMLGGGVYQHQKKKRK